MGWLRDRRRARMRAGSSTSSTTRELARRLGAGYPADPTPATAAALTANLPRGHGPGARAGEAPRPPIATSLPAPPEPPVAGVPTLDLLPIDDRSVIAALGAVGRALDDAIAVTGHAIRVVIERRVG